MVQTDLQPPSPIPHPPSRVPDLQSSPPPAPALSPVAPGICEAAGAGLLLLLALAPTTLLNGDGDAAQHLAVGAVILAQRAAPQIDIFSHAHLGQPFLDWEWGAEAIFAALHAAFGLNGVAILAAALIAGTLYGLCRWMMARGLHPVPALLLGALAAIASEIHWLARPHLFTFLLLPAVLFLLESYRLGRAPARRLALIPPLLLLWANLHPMFVFGLACCAAYLAGAIAEWAGGRGPGAGGWGQYIEIKDELIVGIQHATCNTQHASSVRVYALTLLACTAATLVNPYGLGLWTHIIAYAGGSFTTRLIVELQPPNLAQPITWGFLGLLAVMIALLAATWHAARGRRWRPVPPAHLILLAGWTVLAFQAARNILLFSVLVPALLAPQLAGLLERAATAPRPAIWARYRTLVSPRQGFPWLFGGTLAALVVLAALGGPAESGPLLHARWTAPPFPIGAVQFLRTTPHPPLGKMFNNIVWGGYLLGTLYPEQRIFISTQQDAYGDALNRDYLTAELAQPGWPAILAAYDIGWVIDAPGSPLAAALRAQPAAWQAVYADPVAVIFARRQSAGSPIDLWPATCYNLTERLGYYAKNEIRTTGERTTRPIAGGDLFGVCQAGLRRDQPGRYRRRRGFQQGDGDLLFQEQGELAGRRL